MRHILPSLFLALALEAGAVAQNAGGLPQKSEAANEAATKATIAELHADTAQFLQHGTKISAGTQNTYAACRQSSHWWQVWKRRCSL